uniref:Uncharacterized protein n=1 Tax=viral metagenome TaxID=1070528 RepID=A0A6H1ZE64_9ZZZZ
MSIQATERIWHTVIQNGVRKTALADLTLRIVRSSDGLCYDWNDGTFKAAGSCTTLNQNGTQDDATNNPGAYYWTVGSGSVDHILPAAFVDDEYLFEVTSAAIGYNVSYGVFVRLRRLPAVLSAMFMQNDKALEDGSNDNYVVYEDDGVTALITKSVRNKSGGSITIPSTVPAQEVTS